MSDPRSVIRGMVPNSQPMQESVRIDEMLDECGCGCGGDAGACLAAIGPSAAEVDGQPVTGYGELQKGLPEKLKAFESGDMPQAEVVSLFQELVDSGLLGHLGGQYTTTAMQLAQNGLIKVQEDMGIAGIPEPAGSTAPGHAPAYTDDGANTDPEHGEDPADIPDAEGSTAAGHGNVDSDPRSVKPASGGY
ncbi:hypothetical protein LCGC14_0165020 [marine sediment metagenome]|uniref:DUF7417 domain-containing protein n=1 Tax=marine sediment metagenome TaxID=412755 RepID=A0A0F9XWR2_9ZZZZ